MATLSIMGLYQFDNKIFDRMQIPAGMDRDALITEILTECAELELVYPDWDIMAMAIGSWSRSELAGWVRAWNALQLEYNPLWNVDATIRELETRDLANSDSTLYGKKDTVQHSGSVTDTGTIKDTGTQKNGGTRKDTGTQTVIHSMSEESSSEVKKPGYNSSTLVVTESTNGDHDITNESSTTTNNLTQTDDFTRTDNLQRENNLTETDSRRVEDQLSGTDTRNGTDTGTILRETERHGNIGVTTSMELVRQEYELAEFNVYQMILKSFKRRFCLLVY